MGISQHTNKFCIVDGAKTLITVMQTFNVSGISKSGKNYSIIILLSIM